MPTLWYNKYIKQKGEKATMNNKKFDRNQAIITCLDEMIAENSNVRVIDAYIRSLDVEKLGYQVYTNKVPVI